MAVGGSCIGFRLVTGQQWEHLLIQRRYQEEDHLNSELEHAGDAGFECVGVAVTSGTNILCAILKRPGAKQPAPDDRSAGWHPDPYGRQGQRYWSGTYWTQYTVSADGAQVVDVPTFS
jgi:hypothetical protein